MSANRFIITAVVIVCVSAWLILVYGFVTDCPKTAGYVHCGHHQQTLTR